MKIDVLILYEHIARDLRSSLLLERKLNEKGITTKVIKARWNEGLYNRVIRPKIVIVPWCYDNEEYDYFCSTWLGQYPDNKMKIVNLHCEQISGLSGTDFLLPKNKAQNVIHFVWGNKFKQQLLDRGVNEELIYVVGSPKMDFFRQQYMSINKKKEVLSYEYGLSVDKKWILIIGNFSAMTHSQEFLDRAKEKGFSAIGKMAEISKKAYNEILDWIDDTLPEYRKYEFIYRPHPSENSTTRITQIEKDNPNFHVIKGSTISDWIVNSEMAFAWCSTSAFEVVLADVPIVNFRPFEFPEELKFPMLEEIEQVSNAESFRHYIDMIEGHEFGDLNNKFRDSLATYFLLREKPTVDLSVETIQGLLVNNVGFVNTKYNYINGIVKSIRYILKNVALKLGFRSKGMSNTLLNDLISKKEMTEYKTQINNL